MKGGIIFVRNQSSTGVVSVWSFGATDKPLAEKWGGFCRTRSGSRCTGRRATAARRGRDEFIGVILDIVWLYLGMATRRMQAVFASGGAAQPATASGKSLIGSSDGVLWSSSGISDAGSTPRPVRRTSPKRLSRERGPQHIVATAFSVIPKCRCPRRKMRKSWFFVLQRGVKRGIISLFNGVKWGGYITLVRSRFSRIAFDRSVGSIILAL